jgi:hypothetical protein
MRRVVTYLSGRVRLLAGAAAFLVLGAGAGSCVDPTGPGDYACALGPMALPPITTAPCNITTTGCPNVKPPQAQTLVSVATCIYSSGAPCTPQVTTCPLIDPNGNTAIPFEISSQKCSEEVRVIVQASGDGGAGIEWRAQQRRPDGEECVADGPLRTGVANVNGSCCATTIDVPLVTVQRTFRFTVRTDWRN